MYTNTALVMAAATGTSVNRGFALGPVTEARDLSVVAHKTSARAVMNAAHVDWRVAKQPMYLGNGHVVPGAFALVREDTGAPLATVGARYRVNQNTDGLDAFDAAMDAGLIRGYSNAGTFGGGKLVWIQAEIGDPFTVRGDEMRQYLTLQISHGSRMTDKFAPCVTRIVCRNTFMMAHNEQGGVRMRHDDRGSQTFQAACDVIRQAAARIQAFRLQAEALAAKSMTGTQIHNFVAELLPSEDAIPSQRLQNVRREVIDLVESGAGNYAVRGTAWGAWNAVTEYVDHHRSTRRSADNSMEDSRLASAWFGTGAQLKERALSMLLA